MLNSTIQVYVHTYSDPQFQSLMRAQNANDGAFYTQQYRLEKKNYFITQTQNAQDIVRENRTVDDRKCLFLVSCITSSLLKGKARLGNKKEKLRIVDLSYTFCS